jgi:hypothetical protein
MTEEVFFQVNEFGVTYVTQDRRILKSQERPPMSFDYTILTYSPEEKTVYHNLSKRDLTEEEQQEVLQYVTSIQENPDLTRQMAMNMQAKQFLNNTDWYVTRYVEKGIPIPEEIQIQRENARGVIV